MLSTSKHALQCAIVRGLCLALVSHMLPREVQASGCPGENSVIPSGLWRRDTLPILFVDQKNVNAMGAITF